MGLLRLILALSVVQAHVVFFRPFFFIQAGISVIIFYVISGFYMSLVISTKYSKSGPGWEKDFLLQRAVRLLPVYWVILAATLAVNAAMGINTIFTSTLGMDLNYYILKLISNITLLGMDVMVAIDTTTANGGVVGNNIWQHYPVATAWTLGVELTFYIFAAFFALRNKRNALVALCIAIYMRVYFLLVNGKFLGISSTGVGYSNNPWGYHFFGVCLIYFMLGWVAYQIYEKLENELKENPSFIWQIRFFSFFFTALLLFAAYVFDGFREIADYNDYRVWIALLVAVPLIPPLFLLTKNSKIDEYLGRYSYVIYLSHVQLVVGGNYFFGISQHSPAINAVLVAVGSIAIVHMIEIPVERFRNHLKSRKIRNPIT